MDTHKTDNLARKSRCASAHATNTCAHERVHAHMSVCTTYARTHACKCTCVPFRSPLSCLPVSSSQSLLFPDSVPVCARRHSPTATLWPLGVHGYHHHGLISLFVADVSQIAPLRIQPCNVPISSMSPARSASLQPFCIRLVGSTMHKYAHASYLSTRTNPTQVFVSPS